MTDTYILLAFAALLLLAVAVGFLYMRQLRIHYRFAMERAEKTEADNKHLQQLYNSSIARIAALESENNSLLQRLDIQKEEHRLLVTQMRTEFKAMAGEALERNAEIFNRRSEEQLTAMLRPFNLDLNTFRDKVESLYGEESRQRFALQESIKSLVEANRRISDDAVNLTNALVGTRNNKFQGDWGETVLEQILENSGLVEGEQWERQATLRNAAGGAIINDDSNKAMRPDIIVHFPGKRDIIIDSKVSLTAYMAYLSSEDETSRSLAIKEHVNSLRRHVDELAAKSYDKYNIHSLDYVMLFVPNEPSYFMAMDADSSLWNYAYKKGVVVIPPSNLISTLFVVNSLWTRERQQRDVQKIVDAANALYDKFVSFTDNFTKIEAAIEKAHDAYRDAHRQLTTGKGNITRRLEDIKRQGLLTTNKNISEQMLPED